MLPAWATVLIALGASAIGALAGVTGSYFTLRGARLSIEHSERQAWGTRLVDAAQEFSHAVVTAVTRQLLATPAADPYLVPAAVVETIEANLIDVINKAIRVGLLFGDESPAGQAANETKDEMGEAYQGLRDLGDVEPDKRAAEVMRIEEILEAADEAHHRFMLAAHDAIKVSLTVPGVQT